MHRSLLYGVARWSCALVAAAVLLAAPVEAQTIIRTGSRGSISFSSSGEVPPELLALSQGEQAAAAGGEEKPKAESERAKKLEKLEYDRRPSAILAAWTLELTPPERPSELDGPADGAIDGAVVAEDVEEEGDDGEEGDAEGAEGAEEAEGAEGAEEESKESEGSDGNEGDKEARKAAEKVAKEAEKAAEKAAKEAAKKLEEVRKKYDGAVLEHELKVLQRAVSLGDWGFVRGYFEGLTDDEHAIGHQQMLESLARGPKDKPQVPQQGRPYLEVNRFAPADVLALAGCAPRGDDGAISDARLALLGQILGQAFVAGHQMESFLAGLRPRLDDEGVELTRRELTKVLVAAERPIGLEGLLPTAEEAIAADDREALNLLARYVLARHAEEPRTQWLEEAWTVTLAALADGEIGAEAKAEALTRAVEIAPRLRDELGQAWLDESFTARPERGREILAAIGTVTSQGLQAKPLEPDLRNSYLELQQTAARALLDVAPQLAGEWRDELDLLASNWLREAQVTYQFDQSTSRGPSMRRDVYGNFFYFDGGFQQRNNMVQPIATGKLLELRPGDDWLALVGDTLRPRLHMVYAQLLLKISEEDEAFPHIEGVAATDPRTAEELVDEFLRVWAKNHNPNQQNSRANSYVFFFGFEQRANAIPLTRSKQERNLSELAEWVARLRVLPVEVDDQLLVEAFKSAHSTAEVYRVDTLERIFGSLADLEPDTLAALMGQMRENLATIWRDPAVQDDAKTKRRQKDIQTEVLRGYELARATVDAALRDHAESWELVLARGALEHDENNYRAELARDTEFAARRASAFESFAEAARLYAAALSEIEPDDESVAVYDTWFHAALGACDLREIEPKHVLVESQTDAVRAALDALPPERAERHRDRIASQLFARMSSLNPGVKYRYVREGLELVGEHELTADARALFDYYSDLVTEIQLRATLDGPDRVGAGQPFGLRLDIRHTAEIERESGGFAKYLQNQNNANFGYNYGRPLEDYRDKFEEAAREALSEHFEVRSITFNEPTAHSIADAQYGWRITPYAYVLLAARGPQVDSLPALRLDLDFLDTSGYAVLPVESAVLPIDATQREPRPCERIALTQLLDERQAKDGKLLLEVKAEGVGLLPELEALVDLAPEGFEVAKTVDEGVAVVKFDDELDGLACERRWTVELRAAEGLDALPKSFAFATPRLETAKSEHFRYVDADLAAVGPLVELERLYGEVERPWLVWGPLALLLAAAGVWGWLKSRPAETESAARFPVPEPLTPFSVIGYLRTIHERNGLDDAGHAEIEDLIERLERHYFVEPVGDDPDLAVIARRWAERAGGAKGRLQENGPT
ncbi:MAG TPA: hypothetical protein VMT18_10980 [Planctomycetota bacterium]|nr:hypothetical protein [Planctomycetota bacterium]